MTVLISNLSDADVPEARAFLASNAETSMFLSSNLTNYGPSLSDHLNSGNFKLLKTDSEVQGVFCLTRRGNLLAETAGAIQHVPEILEACRSEPISIAGVVGEWRIADAIWQALLHEGQISEVLHTSREPLYRLDLDPSIHHVSTQSTITQLDPDDFERWLLLNNAYLKEEGLPVQGSLEQRRAHFDERARSGHWWGLWDDGNLSAIGGLNAVHESTGQIGGVYTVPDQRRRGLATRLMMAVITGSMVSHELEKLILFTGDTNLAAQRLYESLGFERVGEFALLFGSPREADVQ